MLFFFFWGGGGGPFSFFLSSSSFLTVVVTIALLNLCMHRNHTVALHLSDIDLKKNEYFLDAI